MTQAWNLSQLGNKVNASGQLDVAIGAVNALPVANGGTGAATLAANNVILGNGTGIVQVVAPGTSGNVLKSNGTTWQSVVSAGITSGTAVASTSGTSIDFTGIPSWAKRVTVMFNGVSTNGASNLLVQIGAGSVATTGYLGGSSNISSGVTTTSYTTGFGIRGYDAASFLMAGSISIKLLSGFIYIADGVLGTAISNVTNTTAGNVTLSGLLDRVRITTVNGTDTFDAGSINILYE